MIAWKTATFRIGLTLYEEEEGGPVRDLNGFIGSLIAKDRQTGATLLTLDTGNGGIEFTADVLGEPTGEIVVYISKADLTEQEWDQAIYDFTITAPDDGDTEALFWGAFVIRSA